MPFRPKAPEVKLAYYFWHLVRNLPTLHQVCIHVQWNPYIADTIRELYVGRYRGPAVAEGFYKYYMNEIQT